MAETQDPLLKQVFALLDGGQAHVGLAGAIQDLPEAARGAAVERMPYTIWQLLEHMRFTQRDILDFSSPPTGGYQAHEWPKDYWPEAKAPRPGEWERTLEALAADLDKFKGLLRRPGVDLYRPFLWGDGQNLMREALLIADHNAYHVAEIVAMRRLLSCWTAPVR